MKQNQRGQQGKNANTGEKKDQGEANSNSKNTMKNEDEPKKEPIPATPRKEYEDPGHEHVYRPPT